MRGRGRDLIESFRASTFRVTIEQGDRRYFKPLCEVLTETLIINMRNIEGTSSIYVSSDEKNPAAFDYEWKDDTANGNKLMLIKRKPGAAQGPIFIGVQGTSKTPAVVELQVYNDLFPGAASSTVTVLEGGAGGKSLYTPPAPKFIQASSKPNIEFKINDPSMPFSVDRVTGELRTTEPLVYARQKSWNVQIDADATDGPNAKCVKGAVVVVVNVQPRTTTTRTTVTSTTTTVTTVTTTTVTTTVTTTTTTTATTTTATTTTTITTTTTTTTTITTTTATTTTSTTTTATTTTATSTTITTITATTITVTTITATTITVTTTTTVAPVPVPVATAPQASPTSTLEPPAATSNVTITTTTTTANSSSAADAALAPGSGDDDDDDSGAIAAVIIILLLVLAALLAVFLMKRKDATGGAKAYDPKRSTMTDFSAMEMTPNTIMMEAINEQQQSADGSHGTISNQTYGAMDPEDGSHGTIANATYMGVVPGNEHGDALYDNAQELDSRGGAINNANYTAVGALNPRIGALANDTYAYAGEGDDLYADPAVNNDGLYDSAANSTGGNAAEAEGLYDTATVNAGAGAGGYLPATDDAALYDTAALNQDAPGYLGIGSHDATQVYDTATASAQAPVAGQVYDTAAHDAVDDYVPPLPMKKKNMPTPAPRPTPPSITVSRPPLAKPRTTLRLLNDAYDAAESTDAQYDTAAASSEPTAAWNNADQPCMDGIEEVETRTRVLSTMSTLSMTRTESYSDSVKPLQRPIAGSSEAAEA